MMEWINVKDGLPCLVNIQEEVIGSYSETVFVTDGKRIALCKLFYFGNEYSWSPDYYIGADIRDKDVTHWMPLPKPPEE